MSEIIELVSVLKESEFFALDVLDETSEQDLVSQAELQEEYNLPENFFDFFEVEQKVA